MNKEAQIEDLQVRLIPYMEKTNARPPHSLARELAQALHDAGCRILKEKPPVLTKEQLQKLWDDWVGIPDVDMFFAQAGLDACWDYCVGEKEPGGRLPPGPDVIIRCRGGKM